MRRLDTQVKVVPAERFRQANSSTESLHNRTHRVAVLYAVDSLKCNY